jgi:hypothetical protein
LYIVLAGLVKSQDTAALAVLQEYICQWSESDFDAIANDITALLQHSRLLF